MRIIYCVIVLFFISINGFSQIEKPNRSIKISPKKKPDAPLKPITTATTPAIIKYESSLNKNNDAKLLKGITLLPKKEEKGIMEKEPIRNPSEMYTQKFNEKLKKEGVSPELFKNDIFLGQFVVYTVQINIASRDYGMIDGDLVRIWLNGVMVKDQFYLESDFKNLFLNLNKGINTIEIEAINYGELSPNTGQFTFFDGDNKVVTNQYWNLGIGYKARILIEYKDKILKLSDEK